MKSTNQKTIKWPVWKRFLFGILLAGLSAVLLTLSMPPFGIWPLAILGLIPMLLAQYRILPRKTASLAPAIAIGGVVALYIMPAFLGLPGAPWYMRGLPLLFAAIIFLTDQGIPAFHNRTNYRWFVLTGALGWVGIELVRSFIPMIGTWGFIGYAYFKQPWLIQPVSIFGIYGMSLISLLVGFALGLLFLAWFDLRWITDETNIPVVFKTAKNWMFGTAAAFGGWMILSLILLIPSTKQTQMVQVTAVQPGFETLWTEDELETHNMSGKRFDEVYNQVFQLLMEQSKQAANSQKTDLIIWPEGSIKFDPKQLLPKTFKDLAADTKAHLVIPYFVGTRNEVTVVNPSGTFLGVYGKDHPVIFVNEVSSTGGTYPVFDTELGKLGMIICYDLDFTDTARKVAKNGAQIIAVPSGDFPGITDKHYAHVVFRAVENRVSMIKVDRSYDSAIIDPYGRIIEKVISNTPVEATLSAAVPVIEANPLQRTLGDWIGWISLAGMIGLTVMQVTSKTQTKKEHEK